MEKYHLNIVVMSTLDISVQLHQTTLLQLTLTLLMYHLELNGRQKKLLMGRSVSRNMMGIMFIYAHLTTIEEALLLFMVGCVTLIMYELSVFDIKLFCSTYVAPSSAPSTPSLIKSTKTTVTVGWTYSNISDADGYTVNVSSYSSYTITKVEGSNSNQLSITGLVPGTTYNITVRAYQDILGPASNPLTVKLQNS